MGLVGKVEFARPVGDQVSVKANLSREQGSVKFTNRRY